jgi:hypothetical protein
MNTELIRVEIIDYEGIIQHELMLEAASDNVGSLNRFVKFIDTFMTGEYTMKVTKYKSIA